ncbi:MAG: hypothetical protein ACOY3I_02560 [Verrucomicrobiota bacterium]
MIGNWEKKEHQRRWGGALERARQRRAQKIRSLAFYLIAKARDAKNVIENGSMSKDHAQYLKGQWHAIKDYLREQAQQHPSIYQEFIEPAECYNLSGDLKAYEQIAKNHPTYPDEKTVRNWSHIFLEIEHPEVRCLRDRKKIHTLLNNLMKNKKWMHGEEASEWKEIKDYQYQNPEVFLNDYRSFLRQKVCLIEALDRSEGTPEARQRSQALYDFCASTPWTLFENVGVNYHTGLPQPHSNGEKDNYDMVVRNRGYRECCVAIHRLEHELFSASIADPSKIVAQSKIALGVPPKTA